MKELSFLVIRSCRIVKTRCQTQMNKCWAESKKWKLNWIVLSTATIVSGAEKIVVWNKIETNCKNPQFFTYKSICVSLFWNSKAEQPEDNLFNLLEKFYYRLLLYLFVFLYYLLLLYLYLYTEESISCVFNLSLWESGRTLFNFVVYYKNKQTKCLVFWVWVRFKSF